MFPLVNLLHSQIIMRRIYIEIQAFLKKRKNAADRKKLTNPNVSIITNHCMGGFMYHDLGLQFHSPTINLKIVPDEFIEFVEHIEYFLQQEVLECLDITSPCPVGMIPYKDGQGNIHIHFVHYKTFADGARKWKERAQRVDLKNIVVFLTARDGCEESTLQRFENLPYQQRICYTNEPHPEFPHCKYARLDNSKPLVGYISDMVNIFGKRAFECNGFNYVEFINGKDQLPYK